MREFNLKVCLVTAHVWDGKFDKINIGNDFWNLYYWMLLLDAQHYSYDTVVKDISILKDFDVVILNGHPSYIDKLILIAEKLKCITIFYPEGDTSLYHDRGLCPDIIRAWNACSILACLEEDKVSFYESITHSLVKFIPQPVPDYMVKGAFRAGPELKDDWLLTYGDNNPTNYIVAVGVARRLQLPLRITAVSREVCDFIRDYLGVKVYYPIHLDAKGQQEDKVVALPQDMFMKNFMSRSKVCLHTSRWVGTSRMAITGACCGTAVIGWNGSHTQKRLFPELAVDLYDTDKICHLVRKLYKDYDFYKMTANFAFKQVEFYSEQNALNRMLSVIKEVQLRRVGK